MPKTILSMQRYVQRHQRLSLLAGLLLFVGVLVLLVPYLPGAAAVVPPDSDGDGQSDLAEILAGTDPHDPRSVFRIVGEPIRRPGGLWRVTWQSVSNKTYTLQRLADGANTFTDSSWVDVMTVAATGPTTFADAAASSARGYFRVKLAGIASPPVMLPPVRLTNSGWRLFWSSVSGRTYQLQRTAQPQTNHTQWFDVASVVATGPTAFADDFAGGGTGQRFYRVVELPPSYGPVVVAVTNRTQFVPLGGDGHAQEGALVQPGNNGVLAAFEFRPGGLDVAGQGQGFFLRFPQGARLVEENGGKFLEFSAAAAGFGPGSPVQIIPALNKLGGATKRISLSSLSVADLLAAFDLPADGGLELVLFDAVHLKVKAGVFEDGRLKRARFSVSLTGLPLPGDSGDYPEFSLDLPPTEGVRIPFFGEFTLPDGSASSPTLSIPAKRPVWLTILPNGHLSLVGRADLTFPDGPSFSVDLGLDDPLYHLQIVATGIHVPLIGSLAQFLPATPESCLPANANAAQMDAARLCLSRYDCAFVNFSAATVGAAPAAAPSATPDAPPAEFNTANAVLDAWSYSALASASQHLPLDPLRELLKQTGRSASAGRSVNQIVCNQLALVRAKQAAANGAFAGNAAAQADLDAAIAEATAAAIRAANAPDATLNLNNFIAAAKCLLEVKAILQSFNNAPLEASLTSAITGLFQRFAADETSRLGIAPNVFLPPVGGTVAGLNRFVALQKMKNWSEFLGDAQALGIDLQIDAPVQESLAQLALRVWQLAESRLNEAEAANDYLGFLYAFEDVLELVKLRQTGFLPDNAALAVMPYEFDLADFSARLATVFMHDPSRQSADVALANQSAELRRLTRLLQDVPDGVTYAAGPCQRAYDRLETSLATAMNTLTTHRDLSVLLELLEAGRLHAQLRDQFNFTEAVSWETTRLPVLVARIAEVAGEKQGWSELHQAAGGLLQESDRLAAGNNAAHRKLYLEQTIVLLHAAHDVAVALWQDEASRRQANPLLQAADLLLPGDLHVDKVAGSVSYDRSSRALEGAFSGELRLPKFDLALAVDNASFTSGGEFDLNAHGSVVLPSAADPRVRLSITPQHPLHVQFRAPRELKVSGGGKVEAGGMTFEAYFGLEDPLYVFGASAQGIRFDLADKLKLLVPTLAPNEVYDAATARALTDYFASLNASFEGLTPSAPAPGPAAVSLQDASPPSTASGEPPTFAPGFGPSPVDALEAWANAELVDARLHVVRDYAATVDAVTRQLRVLGDSLRSKPGKLDLPGLLVRDQLLKRICDALRAKQQKANTNEYLRLIAAPEFATFLTETENGIIALLNSDDTNLLDHAVEITGLAGSFTEQIKCFLDHDPSRIQEAYQQFLVGQSRNLFDHFGLNPTTGEALQPPVKLNSITNRTELRAGLTNLIRFSFYYQISGRQETLENFRTASRVVALQWRHVLYERIKELAPADWMEFFAKLDGLRHQRQDPVGCRAPEVPDLLNLYAELRALRTDLGLMIQISQESFEWPASGIEQPYGPSAAFELGLEIENANKAWSEALLFANNTKPDGQPIGNGKDNRVTKCETVTKYVPEEMKTRPVLVSRRLDMEQLVGDDFKKRTPEEAALANATVANPKAQALVDQAAQAAVDDAERRLLESAGIVRKPLGLALLENLIKLATWAQEHDPSKLPLIQLHIGEFTDTIVADSGSGAGPGPAAASSDTPAWLGLADYTRQLIDASELDVFHDAPEVRQALLTQASKLIRAQAGAAGRLASLLPSVRPVEFQLPGDLVINRVFGEVQFRRDTGLVSGTFGGRLEFPNLQNAFFEINRATLNSDFDFSLDAATAGPLPFDGVRVTASLMATGGLHQPLLLHGTGTMTLSNGPDVAVTMSFDQAAGTLSFDTAVTDLQSMRLTDDAVLFNAGFGFTLKPSAQSGELHANGTAGFFAKGPLPPTVTRTNFQLIADNVSAAVAFHPGGLELRVTNGTLRLPAFFKAGLCVPAPPGSGPAIGLNPAHPVVVTFVADDGHGQPAVSFSGEIDFANIGFNVPDIDGLGAELCTAKLFFNSNRLPYFTNINGTVQIPLPPGQTSRVDILNGAWNIDGFPTGKIALRNDVRLIDYSGFTFKLLALGNTNCPRGSALTVTRGADNLPRFAVDGGIELTVPASMLTGATGDTVRAVSCGTLFLEPPPALPDLRIDTFGVGGTFHLGGADGLFVTNALLTLTGFENLFNPTTDHPFEAHLGGTLKIPNGPAFTLNDARFVFFDRDRLPRFDIAGLGYDASGFTLAQALPARVNAASFTFKNRNVELPYLLAPTNVTLTLSAAVSIPSADDPFIAGRVDNIRVSIDARGIPQIESIAGLGLQIGGVALPPIEELGGQLYIGGLTPDPTKMYFAGRVAGSYQGYKVKALMAFNLAGPIGMCLDVNAGSVGIPLGQTGILISGASGGISFVNKNTDPCDFTTYMNANGEPLSTMIQLPAAMSWASLKDITNRFFHAVQAYLPSAPGPALAEVGAEPAPDGGLFGGAPTLVPPSEDEGLVEGGPALSSLPTLQNGFACPGDCPPATVNIFCQPHPDQARFTNRVIAKFSSIDEATLNNVLHITPQSIAALGNNATVVATNTAHQIRQFVFGVTPPPQTALLDAARVAQITAVVNESLDAMERVFADVLKSVLSTNNAADFYAVIRDKVYEGAPCPDCTLKVTGTITHLAVSSFLSGTVGATLSTAGTIGLVGNVNVLGIPVGKAKGFVAATDDQGKPNPSVCGDVRFVVGPLDLGDLAASMTCKDCVTGVLAEFVKLAQCLGEPVIRQLAQKVAPQLAGLSATQILTQMSDSEKLAFMAEVFQLPPQADLAACFLNQFSNAWTRVQPQMLMCGLVEPKLFGFPMVGKVAEVQAGATKTNIAGLYSYSPTYMIAAALGSATHVPLFLLFPPQDDAKFGFNVSYPDAGQTLVAALSGRFRSANDYAAYAREGFDYMLANATYTTEYSLHPLGAEVLKADTRVLLPNLTAHPARPGSGWIVPDLRGGNLPSRLDVLMLALEAGKLADPLWKGTAADLQQLDARLAGLDLQHDYFPHGGMVGAAKLQFPKALTETPPNYLAALVDPNSSMDILTRLGNASDFLQNYVLAFTNRGALAFYVPAPNPPFFTHPDGSSLTPPELLSAIQTFDASTIQDVGVTQLYPIELAFLKGWFNAQLLGVPIATGSVVALPAGQGRSTGVLQVKVDGPSDGWLKSFVNTASLTFEMKQAPTLTISNWGTQTLARVNLLRGNPPAGTNAATWDQLRNSAWQDFSTALVTNLPKISLDAAIALSMPSPIDAVVTASGSARIVAYSPRFEPAFVGTGPLSEVRRLGGIAFVGNLNFKANGAPLVNVNNAELSVTPQPSGLPALAGRFNAPNFSYQGVGLTGILLDFSSAPNPHFSAAGGVSPISIGGVNGFRIAAVAGGSLTGKLDIARSGSNSTTASLVVGAAQLQLPGLFTETVLIHGASGAKTPFSFSTTDPWSAVLEVTNGLMLRAGGITLVQLTSASLLSPIAIAGTGTSTGSVAISIRGGTSLQFFPGRTYAQNITLDPAGSGSLRISSDGTFELTGNFNGSLPLTGLGLPINTVASGSIRLTQDALTLTGALGAGVLDTVGSGGLTASGTVTINRDGTATSSGSGSVSIPPFSSNTFTLEGFNADNMTATLNNIGLTLSGAYLKVSGLFSQRVLLPPLTVYANGNFTNQLGPLAFDLGNFSFDQINFRLERTGGVWTLRNFSGRVTELGGAANLTVSGSISSDGTFNLTTSGSSTFAVGGFTLNNASMTFARTPPGAPTLAFNGSVTIADFTTLNLGGYVQSDGSYALSNVLTTASVNGYSLANVTNVLRKGTSNYRTLVAGAGPLAYWRLGDTLGTTALNETGAALNGTYQNSPNLLQDGALADSVNANRCATFDGVNQNVLIGNQAAFANISAQLTVEAWIKVKAFDRTWQTIISKGDSAWRVQRDGNNNALAFDTDGLNPPYLSGSRVVNDGQWHHVAAVYDGRAKYLFVDGELDAWTPASGSIAQNSFNVLIGENSQSTGRFWNGSIDEVDVFTRALAPSEILDHYQAGGGVTLSMSARMNFAGFGAADLRGSVSDSGAFHLVAGPVNLPLGGFQLSNGQLRFSRAPLGVASLAVEADLAVPVGPSAHVSGSIASSGNLDVTATLANGRIAVFDFSNLSFNLSGPVSAPTLAMSGQVGVLDLGSLGFGGVISAGGNLALTNVFTGPTFFTFPANSVTNVIRRSPADYRAAVLGDGPVAYWRLNEVSALDKLNDAVGVHGGSYHGTVVVQQPGALAGSTDRSVRFDGASGYISTLREFDFDFSTAVTVEAWIKVSAWTRDWQAIVTKGDSSWRLSRYGNMRTVSFDTTSSAGNHSLPGVRDMDDGQWHHVVGAYDGYAKYLYIDGALEAWAGYAQTLNQNDFPVLLGENAEAPGRFFSGWLDEVAIYGRALTAAEVIDHYQAGGGSVLGTRMKLNFGGAIGSVELSGVLGTGGSASLQASTASIGLRGFSLNNGYFTFARSAGGTAAVNLGGDLSLSALNFTPHVTGTLSNAGFLGFGIDGISGGIRGFQFNNLSLGVIGDVAAASGSMVVSGDLGLANFPSYHLGGTISSGNLVSMNYNLGLNLGGFAAANGLLTFNSFTDLRASGNFDLSVPGATFNNNFFFSGSIDTGGSFSLTGTGALNIGGFATTSSTFTLDNTQVSGNTTLQLSSKPVNVGVSVSLNSGGISVSGSGNVDTGWVKFYDWFPNGNSVGDVSARALGSVSLSSSSLGVITGTLSATFAVWEDRGSSPPDDINSAPGHFGDSWSVNSDGQVDIGYVFTGVRVDFSQNPPFQFSKSSWGFDLW